MLASLVVRRWSWRRPPSKPPPPRSLSSKAARQRRLQAARLFQQGLSRPRSPGGWVSWQTASCWHARWLEGGRRAGRPRPLGPRPTADRQRLAAGGTGAAGRRLGPGIRHRPVDPAAGARRDRRGWRNEPGDGSECVGVFQQAGCQELIIPCSIDPSQVDLLADAVSRSERLRDRSQSGHHRRSQSTSR